MTIQVPLCSPSGQIKQLPSTDGLSPTVIQAAARTIIANPTSSTANTQAITLSTSLAFSGATLIVVDTFAYTYCGGL